MEARDIYGNDLLYNDIVRYDCGRLYECARRNISIDLLVSNDFSFLLERETRENYRVFDMQGWLQEKRGFRNR